LENSHTSTSSAKRQDPRCCKSTKLGEKYQDFQFDFYLKNKQNHKIFVLNQEGEVEVHGTMVVAMNLGSSSRGNGVRSAMFLASLFYAEQVFQEYSMPRIIRYR
jgi:hypothetical protein